MTKVDVIHTIPSTRVDHGGPPRSVVGMCNALARAHARVRLLTARAGAIPLLLPDDPVQARVLRERGPLGVPMRALAFHHALDAECRVRRPSVIHDHGVWQPCNLAVIAFARRWKVPVIVSTKGMLTPWCLGHRAWKKRIGWSAYQHRALDAATALHATGSDEAESLRALGLRNPIFVIPYGVPVPAEASRAFGSRRAIFVGRLHPVKGLPNLLQAWARVRPAGWTLELAGPDELGHRAQLEQLAATLGLDDTVSFVGEVNEERKWERLRAAELFILPSHSENFGISAAEALAAGLPVITTTGTPWRGLPERGCGWWVPPSVEALAAALGDATSLAPERRAEMGAAGRRLAAAEYSWEHVAGQLAAVYTWLADGGPVPATVLR